MKNSVDKKVDVLAKKFQKPCFDEEALVTAVLRLKNRDKKKAFLLALAKWKIYSNMSSLECKAAVDNFSATASCGLCHLYGHSSQNNICRECPIAPKKANSSGCCLEFCRFANNPTRSGALRVYNKIRATYKKLYGE